MRVVRLWLLVVRFNVLFFLFQNFSLAFAAPKSSGSKSGSVIAVSTPSGMLSSPFDEYKFVNDVVLRPSDIPFPLSMKPAINSGVFTIIDQVYSPTVTRYRGKYYMAFGIGIYCLPKNEGVYRDTIGLASSDDGLTWKFEKYLLEPSPYVCTVPPSEWKDGTVNQMNDPALFKVRNDDGSQSVYMVYTLAPWYGAHGCGHIGLAKLSKNFFKPGVDPIEAHNPYFLSADNARDCHNIGYSRPFMYTDEDGSLTLFFDHSDPNKYGHIGYISAPISNVKSLTSLNSAGVKLPNSLTNVYAGANVEVISWKGRAHLLSSAVARAQNLGHKGNVGRPIGPVGNKSGKTITQTFEGLENNFNTNGPGSLTDWPLTTLTGGRWEESHHDTPNFFYDSDNCRPLVYFSGYQPYDKLNSVLAKKLKKAGNIPAWFESVKHGYMAIAVAAPTENPYLEAGTGNCLLGDKNGELYLTSNNGFETSYLVNGQTFYFEGEKLAIWDFYDTEIPSPVAVLTPRKDGYWLVKTRDVRPSIYVVSQDGTRSDAVFNTTGVRVRLGDKIFADYVEVLFGSQ